MKALVGLGRRDAEGLELARIESAPGAPVHATARQNIEQRDLLGQSQRMIQRGECHRGADAQFFRARGRIRAHHRNRGAHAVVVEMMLGQPDRIVGGADP